MELKPNTKLQAGKLTIIKKIGSGGFGITYLAEHALYGRIALKEFFLSTANAYCTRSGNTVSAGNINGGAFGKFKQDFINEAKTLHQLKDIQNVVNVYDYFEENNTVYFFMEYIEGESLQSLVDREGKLPLDTAISYIQQIGNALIQVHKKGILHRDIKPENIIINTRNNAILIDFGIARDFVEGETKTHTGMATMGYAPPEQLVRRAKRGAYTDVFSLGGTLYFCLTGQRPQTKDEIDLDGFIEPKDLNSEIPNDINDAIVQALKRKPSERFQHVRDFLDKLIVDKVTETQVNNDTTTNTFVEKKIKPKQTNEYKHYWGSWSSNFNGGIYLMQISTFVGLYIVLLLFIDMLNINIDAFLSNYMNNTLTIIILTIISGLIISVILILFMEKMEDELSDNAALLHIPIFLILFFIFNIVDIENRYLSSVFHYLSTTFLYITFSLGMIALGSNISGLFETTGEDTSSLDVVSISFFSLGIYHSLLFPEFMFNDNVRIWITIISSGITIIGIIFLLFRKECLIIKSKFSVNLHLIMGLISISILSLFLMSGIDYTPFMYYTLLIPIALSILIIIFKLISYVAFQTSKK